MDGTNIVLLTSYLKITIKFKSLFIYLLVYLLTCWQSPISHSNNSCSLTCWMKSQMAYYYYYYHYHHLLPLYRVFTILYLKQTVSLSYTMLQLFRCDSNWDSSSYFSWQKYCTLTSVLSEVSGSVQYGCFLQFLDVVLCSDILRIILRWFQLSLLLAASLL